MMRFQRLASLGEAQPVHDDDVFRAAPPYGEPPPVGDGALQRVVLSGGQLRDAGVTWERVVAAFNAITWDASPDAAV